MRSKHSHLLKNADVRRWYENVDRGAATTAAIYLRSLGRFCRLMRIKPERLVEQSEKDIYNALLDFVSMMEKRGKAGSYIGSVIKAVRSWLSFNGIGITRKIKIRGLHETPTLRDERVPSQEELKKIFLKADDKSRTICALIAHCGLRPEVMGNYKGTDGLVLSEIQGLELRGGKVSFKQVPAMIRVRASLSKTSHEYFTFLGSEGCSYLKSYLELRIRNGEKVRNSSPVITPKVARKPFIATVNIGDAARKAIRGAGFPWRPYVLRSYFDTQMMLAESKGLVIRDYRTFFMGHKGDIESVYTLNKRRLPPEVVEQMRQSYAKACRYLQTSIESDSEEELSAAFKRQLLLVAGFKPEEITDEYLNMDETEFQTTVREKLQEGLRSSEANQKVVRIHDVERHLMAGWEFVGNLGRDMVILKQSQAA